MLLKATFPAFQKSHSYKTKLPLLIILRYHCDQRQHFILNEAGFTFQNKISRKLHDYRPSQATVHLVVVPRLGKGLGCIKKGMRCKICTKSEHRWIHLLWQPHGN